MAYILADSVGETTTTTGTGALTLAGATFGRRAFGDVMADKDTAIVRIQHTTEDEWEIALAKYDADTDTLSRESVIASSNSNAAVNFSAGTKIVEMVASATDFRRVRSALIVEFEDRTGAPYTLAADDIDKWIEVDDDVTIPEDGDVTWGVGETTTIRNVGEDPVAVEGDDGVTVAPSGMAIVAGGDAILVKRSANLWWISGNLELAE